jgi:hypothetical protein
MLMGEYVVVVLEEEHRSEGPGHSAAGILLGRLDKVHDR